MPSSAAASSPCAPASSGGGHHRSDSEPRRSSGSLRRRLRRKAWVRVTTLFLRSLVLHDRYVARPTEALLRRLRQYFLQVADLLLDVGGRDCILSLPRLGSISSVLTMTLRQPTACGKAEAGRYAS